MANRRRMVDPDIWEDEKINSLEFVGRLFFIGLITQANDYGKLRGNEKLLKAKIFPYDDKIDIKNHLQQLADLEIILIYNINNETFIKIKNWSKYQTLTYKGKDAIPEPILNKPLTNPKPILNKPLRASKEKLSKEKLINTCTDSTQSFWEYYLLKINKKFKFTNDRKNLIRKRLKEGFTLEQLKQAVDRFVQDEWEGRQEHLDLIYCIGKQRGKPDNLEKWLNKPKSMKEMEKEIGI